MLTVLLVSVLVAALACTASDFVLTILLALGFAVLFVFLVNRFAVRRLVRMINELDRIKQHKDAIHSVTVDGEDEIAVLARQINAMLASRHILHPLHVEREKHGLSLQQIFDAVNCGIVVVDASDRRIVTINKAGAAMIGCDRETIVGRVCTSLLCPQHENDCPVLDRHEQVDLNERVVLKNDGSVVPILKNAVTIEHDGHRFLIESFVDISRCKKMEADLKESKARYRQVFDEGLTGDFIISAQGEIIDCNQSFARLFGYESIDAIKQINVSSLFKTFDDWEQMLERVGKNGKLEHVESELVRQNGSPVYCVGNKIGEFNKQGELIRIRGYLFDDTKRVMMERKTRQSRKLEVLGTLAGGIAHDFNNILAVIIGYAEILLKKESCDDQASNYLGNILTAGEKAQELISQILAFNRKMESALQPVQVSSIIHETIKMLRATLPTTITIAEQLDPEAIVMADPAQIHQIVVNLCANAGHAMQKEGGTLTVNLEQISPDPMPHTQDDHQCDEFARLRIEDTGHGIPADIINRIFDPFFTTKDQSSGTGLGLSMVHGIIQRLHGQITVHSIPGKGTRFDILLPLADRHIETNASESLPAASGNEHIIYVDDAPFLAEIAKEILLELGYKVTVFDDSEEALAFICAHPGETDLVISDMTMPRLTGIELAQGIRDAGITTPVIIYTGSEKDLTTADLQSLGISEVLLKPIKPHTLAIKIREVLDHVTKEAAGS